MASLIPCSQCLRHVRRSETQCPFCGAAQAAALAPALDALREAKRATLIALGLALAGQACGGKEDGEPFIPPYGISPGPIYAPDGGSGGTGGASGSSGEGGTLSHPVPPYGLSPLPYPEGGSGGEEQDAGTPGDAGNEDAGGNDAGGEPDDAG